MRWYLSNRLQAVHPWFPLRIWGWCSMSWVRQSNTPATLSPPLSWVTSLVGWWAKSAQQGIRPATDAVQKRRQDQVPKATGLRRQQTARSAQLSQGIPPQAPRFCTSSLWVQTTKELSLSQMLPSRCPSTQLQQCIPCNAECSCVLACGIHCSTTCILGLHSICKTL